MKPVERINMKTVLGNENVTNARAPDKYHYSHIQARAHTQTHTNTLTQNTQREDQKNIYERTC